MKKKIKLSDYKKETQEMYLNYKYQIGEEEAREYLLGYSNATETIIGMASLFFSLAVTNIGVNIAFDSFIIPMIKEKRRTTKLLKKRGIAVIKIIDKDSIETYHPYKGVFKQMREFVKQNDKWIFYKDVQSKIKTGRFILERKYRRYTKKYVEEDDCCESCGREY